MGREIIGTTREFHPMVGLRAVGSYVTGKVTEIGTTTTGKPVVTLSLIDLDGSASKQIAKGQYEEVEVSEGDLVQLIGSVTDLKEKLPQLGIGDTITVTHTENVPSGRGNPKQVFKVIVN